MFCKWLKISLPDEDEDEDEEEEEDEEGEGEFRKAGVIPALMITPAFLGPQDDNVGERRSRYVQRPSTSAPQSR